MKSIKIANDNKKIPLIIEPHPEDYEGYEFLTLIKYYDKSYMCIVDNINKKEIISYVLDFCVPQHVDEQQLLSICNDWFHNRRENHPISIEFSKLGITDNTQKILRTFSLDYVTRVIGPVFHYEMKQSIKIRRRKIKYK